jgi:site-specific DNA recombinase
MSEPARQDVRVRGHDRYACSARVTNGSCANTRTIPRGNLEQRVLAGLKDRMMAPEMAAEAMRTYTEATIRLNRERRASGEGHHSETVKIRSALQQMLSGIEKGGHTRGMTERLRELEAREDVFKGLLAQERANIPDIHPNVSGIYRNKSERLIEALDNHEDRNEATEAIRALVEKITLHRGPNCGGIDATLQG